MSADFMEKIVSLCKRRGFIFQSSEIYGGLESTWDYGPLGVELKRNVKEAWWRAAQWSWFSPVRKFFCAAGNWLFCFFSFSPP